MNRKATNQSLTTVRLAGGRDYLNYSAISLFQACPLRFYFKYILGLPEETIAASLLFGQAVHAAVQFH
jgi:ATP-dependent helicase/DNAse subunit B